jgi:hypothetical protein
MGMDIYCPKTGCGEPVDMDYLHDVADEQGRTYTEVVHDFQARGCEALGESHAVRAASNDSFRAEVMASMFDLLGDDVDGAAAMMEDAEYLGLF